MGSVVNSERMPNLLTIPIGTQASTITLPGAYFRKRCRLKEVRLIDQAGVAASNSNYLIVTLQDVSANPNVYASYETKAANQGALTALTPALMTLGGGSVLGSTAGAVATTVLGDSTNPEVDIAAGASLEIAIVAGGTVTFTDAVMQLEFYPL